MTSHRSETTQIDTRARLIEQNKKLRNEIVQLSYKVDQVIQKKSASTVKKQQQGPTQLDDKKKQLKNQQQYILKLKTKIQELRLSMTTAVDSMNRQQEDKLTKLKKQLKTLDEEKLTLQKLKFDKTKVLKDRDQPHEQVKGQLEEMIATVKLENKDLFDKIMVLERQIRKEHEMAVGFKDAGKEQPNPDNLPEIQAEIKQLEDKKRAIQQKWNGKMEYLDTQFLQLKSAFDLKKRKLDQLTKQVKNWEIRKFVYRDEDSINEVREMLARLPVKPRSQTNTSKNSKAVSMSMIESKPQRTAPIEISTSKDNFRQASPPPKPLDKSFETDIKKTKNQQPPKTVQASLMNVAKTERIELKSKQIPTKNANQKPKQPSRQPSKQPKSHNHRHLQSSIQTHEHKHKHAVNEFMEVSQTFVKNIENQKKEKKLLKSIAIGTSFYYNPNDG